MRDLNFTVKKENVFLLGTIVKRKVIRSRDTVFFENQTIADFVKAKKSNSSNEELVDLGMVRSHIVLVDDNTDVQTNDPTLNEPVDENQQN